MEDLPRAHTRPHRALGSPPRRSRASRQHRLRRCWALAARCMAAAPSSSTRLGSAPRRSKSSTVLGIEGQSGPWHSPPTPSPGLPAPPGPALTATPPPAAPSAAAAPNRQPDPCPGCLLGAATWSRRLPVSNFPRLPCAHAPLRPSAVFSAPWCSAATPARLSGAASSPTSRVGALVLARARDTK